MSLLDKATAIKNGLDIDGVLGVFQGGVDPSVSGADAPIGSAFLRTTGQLYLKVGAGTTDWTELQAGDGVLNNYTAIVDPTVTDDANAGYSVGSHWVNTATDELWVLVDDANGNALWKPASDDSGAANSNVRPGRTFLGDILHYTSSATELDDELMFVRNWYPAGSVISQMELYPTQVGGSSRTVLLGLYDQATPGNTNGTPNNLVAFVPGFTANTVTANAYNVWNLSGGTYTIPTTGYYWHAFLSTGTGGPSTKIKPVVTSGYVIGFTPVRFKAGQTSLPANAGAVTTAGGALIYIATVK